MPLFEAEKTVGTLSFRNEMTWFHQFHVLFFCGVSFSPCLYTSRIHIMAKPGLQINLAVRELFNSRFGNDSFEFDTGTKRTKLERQF